MTDFVENFQFKVSYDQTWSGIGAQNAKINEMIRFVELFQVNTPKMTNAAKTIAESCLRKL